jgi:HSP20 family protein
MFGSTRWSPFDDFFPFQREVDRLFNQFWNDLPTRTAASSPGSFHVNTTEDGWRIDVPLPGVDPKHVSLEAAGTTLTIRVAEPSVDGKEKLTQFEQSVSVPQFLDLDKLTASHQHGMLRLSLPVKESVKPRRIPIEGEQKQLTTA